MHASRVTASTKRKNEAKVGQIKEHRVSRTSKVLAERNQEVAAVGAWVEGGENFLEDPSDLALLTEELQAEKQRENEESLRRFQIEVRHRVARHAHIGKKLRQPHIRPEVTPGRTIPHYQIWTHQVSVGEEEQISARTAARQRKSSPESRQVRLRLAACRVIQQEETTSDLPGGRWNVSPARNRLYSHMLRPEEDVLEEEEHERRDVPLFVSQHKCPLVQQKVGEKTLCVPDNSHPDPGSKSSLREPQILWPLTDQEKVKKKQRQFQFLMHRRLAMNTEREQVKENKQLRKHLKRTARIKAEKEKVRLEEERRLERAQQLALVRQKLEERELLILERLKLEEEEERAVQLQRGKREEKEKDTARYIEALRAQMKERLSQLKLDLPPLCCCASSFWDSHPHHCANNCVFYNNPKAYAKALHSTMASLDLQ